jgi:hypothetical protein
MIDPLSGASREEQIAELIANAEKRLALKPCESVSGCMSRDVVETRSVYCEFGRAQDDELIRDLLAVLKAASPDGWKPLCDQQKDEDDTRVDSQE